MGISFVILFLSFSLFSYSISNLSLAEEGDEYEDDEENLWMINLDDYVVLTWVANTVEYLTALYLYVDDPYSSTSVVLRYDSWLNALLINSSINANAMGIWYNDFGEWVAWSVFVWWSGNTLNKSLIGSYNEYWDQVGSLNWKNDRAVVIWGEKNTAGQAWTVVIWWRDVYLNNTNSLSVVWSNDVRVDNSSVTVVLWGKNVRFGQWAWHWFYAWNHLRWGYTNFLIWSWIDAQSSHHYSQNLQNAFAWSNAASWLLIKGWNLGWQPGFYVNPENGLWFNTSTPRLTFDARSWGPLRLWAFRWLVGEEMIYMSDGSKLMCNEGVDLGNSKDKYRWTVVYVQLYDNLNRFVSAWFCWCNGRDWSPMSNDTVTQYVCSNFNEDDRKQNCLWSESLNNVVFHTGTEWLQRWDEEANGWTWGWVKLNWTFWWVPGLLSWLQRECVYSCKVWYHPNTKSPQGWFTWDCIACSQPPHSVFISPWTWMDDCQFACEAWYKYNWWLGVEDRKERWCTACNYWEWTTWMNQAMVCDRCEYPIWVSARWKNADWTPMKFYSWAMWDAVAKTWDWELYFRGFTRFSTKWKYGCDFDCASWYIYSFGWTEWSNTCTECWTGTYSDWGKATSCWLCENKPKGKIAFAWKDVFGKQHSFANNQIPENEVAWYTSKWKTWANSCEWTCNPSIWLVKIKEWDQWTCKCPDGTHLEKNGIEALCVSNIMDMECQWKLWPKAIIWSHIYTWAGWHGQWNDWTWDPKTWTYSDKTPDKLWACEWTCPDWYQRDNNTNNCKPKLLGKCKFNWVSKWSNYSEEFWYNSNNLCSKSANGSDLDVSIVEINYNDNKKEEGFEFQFYPQTTPRKKPTSPTTNKIKYLVSWTCKWYENRPEFSASCYAYWEWTAKPGVCNNNQRDNWVANPLCVVLDSDCNKTKSCPPIRDIQTANSRKGWEHWKTWYCPWFFWGNTSVQCHSCDDEYTWWNKKEMCTEDIIHEAACSNGPVSDVHVVYSRYDKFWNYDKYSYPDKRFTQIFNSGADNGDGAYKPASMDFEVKSKESDLNWECQFACSPYEDYIWWKWERKCTDRILYPSCGWLGPTSSTNVIWGWRTDWKFTQRFDPSLNGWDWGYSPLSKSFDRKEKVGDLDSGDEWDCQYACAPNTHRYEWTIGRWFRTSTERICADDPDCWKIEWDMTATWRSIHDEENLCTIWDDDDAADGASFNESTKQYEWTCTNKWKDISCYSDPIGCYWTTFDDVAIRVDTDSTVTSYEKHRVYPSESDAKWHQCAWYCDESRHYFYLKSGDNEFCAKCDSKEAVHADEWWCENNNYQSCTWGRIWNPSIKKCMVPWSCSSYPSIMAQENDEITPFYENMSSFNVALSCKGSASEVTPHTCEFSCPTNYVCNGNKDCVKPSCKKPDPDSWIYSTYVNTGVYGNYTSEKPTKYNEDRRYIRANDYASFIQKANAKGWWCYFWCNENWSNFYNQTWIEWPQYKDEWSWAEYRETRSRCWSPAQVEKWKNPSWWNEETCENPNCKEQPDPNHSDYETYVNIGVSGVYTSEKPKKCDEERRYIRADNYSSFVQKANAKGWWCYFWCNENWPNFYNITWIDWPQYKDVWWSWAEYRETRSKCWSIEQVNYWKATKYSCPAEGRPDQEPYPYWPVKWVKNISNLLVNPVNWWQWVSTWEYETTDKYCAWTCKDWWYDLVYYKNVLPWKTPNKYCWKQCNDWEIFTEQWCQECRNNKWLKVDTSTPKYYGNYVQCTDLCPASQWLAFSNKKSECTDENWNSHSYCCVALYADAINSCDIDHGCWLIYDGNNVPTWCGCPPDMTWVN